MTTEELAQLTPDQKRIKIAEACGYSFKDESARYPDDPDWQKYKAVYRGDGFIGLARPEWIPVPDYLSSLEAMAKAEKVLEEHPVAGTLPLYADTLAQIRRCMPGSFAHVSATAAQRADAFLLTVD